MQRTIGASAEAFAARAGATMRSLVSPNAYQLFRP